MKPENYEERALATRRFGILYIVSLLLVAAICYFLFSQPSRLLQEENDQLKNTLAEQTKLLDRMDGMNRSLKTIQTTDQSMATEANEVAKANSLKQVQEQEQAVQTALFEIKRDSLAMVAEINKRLMRNIANSFDAILTYRNVIGGLRQTVQQSGSSANELAQVRSELLAANQQVSMLQMALSVKSSAGGGGGGATRPVAQPAAPAGGGGASEAVVGDLKLQVSLAEAQCQVARADEVRQKSRQERQQLYNTALDTFRRVAQSTSSADTRRDAQNGVSEVTTKLRRLASNDL